jgi:predicted GIY-YIG superfamily endonuclease
MNADLTWFVYILRCGDQSLYTGTARNVAARVAQHEAGRGARYTRGRGPFTICATRRCENQAQALRLEYAIKQLTRAEKERLIWPKRLAAFARQLKARSATEP